MQSRFTRPPELLAGFHADLPDPAVPEILHIGEQWASRRLFIPTHSHAVWELYLQISGETCWDGSECSYTLTPGSFFAVPPRVPHRMHDRPQAKHHFFFAALDLSAVLVRLPAVAALWQSEAIIFLPQGETLLAPFRELVREVSLTLTYRPIGMRLALDVLVLEASRLLGTSNAEVSLMGRHPAVRQAQELLDHQPGRAWRLAHLAQMTGVSAHHLAERFTSEVGISPRQYLLRARITLAHQMLAGSDIAITDLALELGFSSSQHFAATFKRLTGETAQGYRARQRGNT